MFGDEQSGAPVVLLIHETWFVDRLSSWLWQDNEGDARWTLILDDALRHAAVNHPPTTVAGVLHHMAGVEQQLLTMRIDEGHGCLEFAVQASDEPAWAVGRVSAAVLAALMERGFARELATLRDTAAHTGLQQAAMFGHAQAARMLLAAPRRREALVADGDATLDYATRSGTLYSVKGNCDTYWANMLQFPSISSKVPSHFTLVNSGASIHILTCHTFLSDATANHSAVTSFAGSTSRATHKGTFTAFVQCTNNKFHHFVQRHRALVVPDASRTLFSISQALIGGHHVHFGTSPGLLLHHSKAFIPFVRDTHTGMYLLPLIPPISRHNGTYPLQQAMRAAVPAISIPNLPRILPAIPNTQYTPADITLHNTLGHIAHRRGQQLDVGIPQPSGKKVTCPICITAKARRTDRPLPSDVTKRAQHPWQDVSVDLSCKMRIQGISNVYYYIPFVCNFSGAKMVEFVQRKSHFIHAYRWFVARLEECWSSGVIELWGNLDRESKFSTVGLENSCGKEGAVGAVEPGRTNREGGFLFVPPGGLIT
jgi:hypothetical protein